MTVAENPTSVAGESRLLIGGKLVNAKSGKRYANINPATEQIIGEVADAGADDADDAIAAARHAFDHSAWATDRALRKRCLIPLPDAFRDAPPSLRAQAVAETGPPPAITENGPQGDGPIAILDYVIELMDRYDWDSELPVTNTMGVDRKSTRLNSSH